MEWITENKNTKNISNSTFTKVKYKKNYIF